MADKTAIEWTDATWNPVRGCSRISPGCGGPGHAGGCYAEGVAARFSGPGQAFHGFADRDRAGSKWTGKVELIPEMLDLPMRWRRPRRIFVNSMSDLFHEALSFGEVMRVFNVMWQAPQHTFQVLTKRAERMREFMTKWADLSEEDFEPKLVRGPEETRKAHPSGRGQLFADMLDAMGDPPPGCTYPAFDWMGGMIRWPSWPPNVWLGVSAEDQQRADQRIPHLRATPAAVRFLSCEPLLGEIVAADEVECLDWVICGGESGPRARPMHPDWARSLREQCAAAGTPFFFKQHGEWLHESQVPADRRDDFEFEGEAQSGFVRVGKKRAGRLLDGVEHNEFPKENDHG
jgi:protein gp37